MTLGINSFFEIKKTGLTYKIFADSNTYGICCFTFCMNTGMIFPNKSESSDRQQFFEYLTQLTQ